MNFVKIGLTEKGFPEYSTVSQSCLLRVGLFVYLFSFGFVFFFLFNSQKIELLG